MIELRRGAFLMLEGIGRNEGPGRVIDAFLVVLIVTNVAAVILETVESLSIAFGPIFFGFELFSVAVFTLEYFVRLWVCVEERTDIQTMPWTTRIKYVLTPYALIDLFAILPFYLSIFVAVDLRFLRLFRLFRILKLTRYSPALQTFAAVIRNERRSIVAALLVMLIMLIAASSLIFLAERNAQPEKFASIPDAMWWAIATLTTVGYGDVTPVTALGKLLGGVVMLTGIALFVLWTGIFASSFAAELRKRDFVVSWNMVAQVPAFASLDATAIAEIARLLDAVVVPERYTIVRRGEQADCMYFIASGEIEVELHPEPLVLGQGHFFGEVGLLHSTVRNATVIALTECRLLMLDTEDFKTVLERFPEVRNTISKVAEDRLSWQESGEHVDAVQSSSS